MDLGRIFLQLEIWDTASSNLGALEDTWEEQVEKTFFVAYI